ncbi:MAG: type II toxin-antitoxin system RelB/DinJ family antitoxin, partial [Clostridia bacterium]|nr:type II toxin-antitoxin system RelB/DinJ family antitoxin [Clostridia bacterium]
MTQAVTFHLDAPLLRRAEAVCAELGLTTEEAVTRFLETLVQQGGLPFLCADGETARLTRARQLADAERLLRDYA